MNAQLAASLAVWKKVPFDNRIIGGHVLKTVNGFDWFKPVYLFPFSGGRGAAAFPGGRRHGGGSWEFFRGWLFLLYSISC